MQLWLGRLEGLLARHWPEDTRLLTLGSGTLLRLLAHYGGPAGVAAVGVAGGLGGSSLGTLAAFF